MLRVCLTSVLVGLAVASDIELQQANTCTNASLALDAALGDITSDCITERNVVANFDVVDTSVGACGDFERECGGDLARSVVQASLEVISECSNLNTTEADEALATARVEYEAFMSAMVGCVFDPDANAYCKDELASMRVGSFEPQCTPEIDANACESSTCRDTASAFVSGFFGASCCVSGHRAALALPLSQFERSENYFEVEPSLCTHNIELCHAVNEVLNPLGIRFRRFARTTGEQNDETLCGAANSQLQQSLSALSAAPSCEASLAAAVDFEGTGDENSVCSDFEDNCGSLVDQVALDAEDSVRACEDLATQGVNTAQDNLEAALTALRDNVPARLMCQEVSDERCLASVRRLRASEDFSVCRAEMDTEIAFGDQCSQQCQDFAAEWSDELGCCFAAYQAANVIGEYTPLEGGAALRLLRDETCEQPVQACSPVAAYLNGIGYAYPGQPSLECLSPFGSLNAALALLEEKVLDPTGSENNTCTELRQRIAPGTYVVADATARCTALGDCIEQVQDVAMYAVDTLDACAAEALDNDQAFAAFELARNELRLSLQALLLCQERELSPVDSTPSMPSSPAPVPSGDTCLEILRRADDAMTCSQEVAGTCGGACMLGAAVRLNSTGCCDAALRSVQAIASITAPDATITVDPVLCGEAFPACPELSATLEEHNVIVLSEVPPSMECSDALVALQNINVSTECSSTAASVASFGFDDSLVETNCANFANECNSTSRDVAIAALGVFTACRDEAAAGYIGAAIDAVEEARAQLRDHLFAQLYCLRPLPFEEFCYVSLRNNDVIIDGETFAECYAESETSSTCSGECEELFDSYVNEIGCCSFVTSIAQSIDALTVPSTAPSVSNNLCGQQVETCTDVGSILESVGLSFQNTSVMITTIPTMSPTPAPPSPAPTAADAAPPTPELTEVRIVVPTADIVGIGASGGASTVGVPMISLVLAALVGTLLLDCC